jgi:hypothetical protein
MLSNYSLKSLCLSDRLIAVREEVYRHLVFRSVLDQYKVAKATRMMNVLIRLHDGTVYLVGRSVALCQLNP